MRSRVENGILVTETSLRTTCVVELGFPPRYAQPRLEPELGYLAVVLDGGLQKTFANRTLVLGAGTATTIPADAGHSATFGEQGARILIVKPQSTADEPYRGLLGGIRTRRDPGLAALAGRIATELAAPDSAAPIAVEGLALELIAAALRAIPTRIASARPAWLAGVVERLHEPSAELPGLGDLAEGASVDPGASRTGLSPSLRRLGRHVRAPAAAGFGGCDSGRNRCAACTDRRRAGLRRPEPFHASLQAAHGRDPGALPAAGRGGLEPAAGRADA